MSSWKQSSVCVKNETKEIKGNIDTHTNTKIEKIKELESKEEKTQKNRESSTEKR